MNFHRKIYFIPLYFIVFFFLISCSSHQHSFGEYEFDEHLHWKKCEGCNEKQEYVYHTFSVWQIVIEPTEVTKGLRRQVCSACGFTRTMEMDVISHIHQYSPWEFSSFPSYTSAGQIVRRCSLNETHTETFDIPALNPTYYRYELLEAASCSHPGKEIYSFYKDNQLLQIPVTIPLNDHTFDTLWSMNEEGHWHAAICEHTGLTKDFESHTYYNGYCTICNYKEPIEEHFHQFGDWSLITSPTVDELGLLKRVCLTNENHVEYKELPILSKEDYVYQIERPASCSEEGLATYTIVVDNQNFVFEISLPLTDHSYSEDWSMDNVSHWHASTCVHLDEKKDVESHVFENGRCTICNYVGYSEGLIYELNEDMSGFVVVGIGSFKDKELVIPGVYQGLPIKKINSSVFKDSLFLEAVRIQSGIEVLGDSLFKGCTNLKTIELPLTLKGIENNCFEGCSLLEEISLPDSVEVLGDYIWKDCSNLKHIEFSSSLKQIGNQLVDGCKNLNYNAYDQAMYLGNKENPYLILMQASDPLIASCIIHEKTRFIHSMAFSECSLRNIALPQNIISIGNNAFHFCLRLEYIILNENLSSIGRSALAECNQLAYVFYMGNEEELADIEISLTNPILDKIYYYSDQPSKTGEWSFDDNQVPIPYGKNGEEL